MNWRAFLSGLTFLSAFGVAADEAQNIRWLYWPVTGVPVEQVDEGIFYPSGGDFFTAVVDREVLIGLRADGVVVWKYVDALPQNTSQKGSEGVTSSGANKGGCRAEK